MRKKTFLSDKRAITLGLIFCGVVAFGLPLFCFATTYETGTLLTEDFESFNVGYNINNEANWFCDLLSYVGFISTTTAKTGSKSLVFNPQAVTGTAYCQASAKNSDRYIAGSEKLFMKKMVGATYGCQEKIILQYGGTGSELAHFQLRLNGATCHVDIVYGDGSYLATSTASSTLGTYTYGLWGGFSFEWKNTNHPSAGGEVRFMVNDNEPSNWFPTYRSYAVGSEPTTIRLIHNRRSTTYWDTFGEAEFPLPELRVWVDTPASGSTATSTTENFTIKWEGWDFEWIYKDFVFSFYEKNTGILTGTEIFEPLTKSGTKTYSFSDFGISKNGDYYLRAKARSYLYEYTAYYTGDLVNPAWWIRIDVEGWEDIFEMPDYTTWYAENSKFATPTAMFIGITDFLAPVFNKIGEFGNSVVSFLNLDEAYDRGYDLGKIIPLFKHYIEEIEVFFGGFPIIQIFLAFLIILLGIFIVRLILKFIPGLG